MIQSVCRGVSIWSLGLVVGSCLLGSSALAQEPPVVVVYDLEARGVEAYVASSFTDLLCVELSHTQGIETRCKSDIDTLLQHTSNRQLLGCRDDGCLTQVSEALSNRAPPRTGALMISRHGSVCLGDPVG